MKTPSFVCQGLVVAPENIMKGKEMHVEAVKQGSGGEFFLGNMLVEIYAKTNLFAETDHIFLLHCFQGMVGWTSLIAGYAKIEHYMEAQCFLEEIQLDVISPDAITYVFSL